MNKVFLLNPPYYVSKNKMNFCPSFPLGMGYIASYLEGKGYSVKAVDAFGEGYDNQVAHDDEYLRIGLSDEQILSEIADYSPDIIGISNLFSMQYFSVHSIAKVLKESNKDIPIVIGGPHVSAVPELVMTDNNIDYGVMGEGERTFHELLIALSNERDLKDVAGIAYREKGEIKVNKAKQYIENLDEIPFPAWHLFKMDKYLFQEKSQGGEVRKHPFMTICTSRGCPLNCLFCSGRETWGRHLRTRSAENVIEEIMLLRKKYGIKEIIIIDDNFNYDVGRLNAILDYIIKEKLDLVFELPSGIYIPKLSKDILIKMKRAGFHKLYFPIESGNEYFLHKIIRKPVKLAIARELVAFCREIDIEVRGYFILGLPGETKKQMKDTFKLVRELKIKPYFSIATPFPGSDLYRYAEAKGLLKSVDIDKCSDEYNISTSDWSAEELKRIVWREEFKRNFISKLVSFVRNPNPMRIIHFIKRIIKVLSGR